MKFFLLPFVIATYLFGGTPAKIASISSSSRNVSAKSNSLVFENDTVKIDYDFWEERGAMNFKIYNKLDIPIYIDWKNSSFIAEDFTISYWQDETNTFSLSANHAVWSKESGVSLRALSSTSIKPERISSIPPHSSISKISYKIIPQILAIPKSEVFAQENSFYSFRNFLSLNTNESFTGNSCIIDNNFYISRLFKINWSSINGYRTADAFYFKVNEPKKEEFLPQ